MTGSAPPELAYWTRGWHATGFSFALRKSAVIAFAWQFPAPFRRAGKARHLSDRRGVDDAHVFELFDELFEGQRHAPDSEFVGTCSRQLANQPQGWIVVPF